MFDSDNSGFISPDEIKCALADSDKNIPERIIDSIMEIADTNKDGQISLEEFLNAMKNCDTDIIDSKCE